MSSEPINDSTPSSTTSAAGNPVITEEMNAEIEAAMKEMEKQPVEAPKARPAPIRGPRVIQGGREHRTGKIVSVGPDDIFIDFGPKELGVIPRIQYTEETLPKVGDSLEVVVDKFESSESLFICSRPGSVQKADWEMLEQGQVIEARVTGVNKGGLELDVAGHKAFMPAGQVSIEHIKDLSVFIGEKMKCAVSRLDRTGRGNIIVSRRDVLEMERQETAGKLRETLAEGQTVQGTVRKIMPFGAFVDIGGIDGLVHISDLTYDRVGFGEKAIEKFIKEGQQVNVRILKLDWDNKRISLGLKQTQGDPFETAVNAIVEGAEVSGRVTKIMDFGAFVEIGPGVEGLVHISELDYRRIAQVSDAVKQDEIVRAKVIKIDKDNRRISLSIKALKAPPEMPKPADGAGGGPGRGGPGGQGGGRGPGGGGGGRGGPGGPGGRGRREDFGGRTAEEILKETPALRRMREQAKKNQKFKGGLG